jgi:hypothetical protein
MPGLLLGCSNLPGSDSSDTASTQATIEPPSQATALSRHYVEIGFNTPASEEALQTERYSITAPDSTPLHVMDTQFGADRTSIILTTEAQDTVEYVLTMQSASRDAALQPDHLPWQRTAVRVLTAAAHTAATLTTVPLAEATSARSDGVTFTGSSVSEPFLATAIALSNTSVLLTFSEQMESTAAQNIAFYRIVAADASPPARDVGNIVITNAVLNADKTTVVLTTSSQDDREYTVIATNQKRRSGGHLIDPFRNTATFFGIAPIDTTSPRVVSAFSTGSTSILLTFSEAMADNAIDPAHVTITGCPAAAAPCAPGTEDPLGVTAAVLSLHRTQVLLTTLPQEEDIVYTVTVTQGQDVAGNAMNPAANTATFTFDPQVTGGGEGSGAATSGASSPRVVGAISTGNTTILVQFSSPMSVSALEPTNYSIVQENVHPEVGTLGVLPTPAPSFLDGRRTAVVLTTLSQNEVRYRVTVVNVVDLEGRPLVPAVTTTGVPNPTSALFAGTPPSGTQFVDSDGDGLSDNEELRGYLVTIVLVDDTVVTRQVTSDPSNADTDGDGVSDRDEKIYLTDPRNADSDNDGLSDFQELNFVYSDPFRQDSDEDGLGDGLEFLFFKTSPLLADTDGDQFSDSQELFTANRNPRSADLPLHRIIVGEATVELEVEFSFTSETRQLTDVSRTETNTFENSDTTETTTTDTTTRDWFAKAGVTVKAAVNYPLSFEASAEFTAEAGVGIANTFTSTSESKATAQKTFQDSQVSGKQLQEGETETRTVTGARLIIPLIIENAGDVAFTMENVEVTALIPNPRNLISFTPIGTLLADEGTETTYNLGTIDTRRGPFRFATRPGNINPDFMEELLRNPENIIFEVSNFKIVDEEGRSFTFRQQDVTERTVPIGIDFGNGTLERHWAAIGVGRIAPFADTNGDGIIDAQDSSDNNGDGVVNADDRIIFDANGMPVGITLFQALTEILGLTHIDLDTGPDVTAAGARRRSFATQTLPVRLQDTNGDGLINDQDASIGVRTVTRIREIANDIAGRRAWILLTRAGYDPLLPVDAVVLTRGKGVTLVFTIDADGDTVPRSLEVIYGSSDNSTDSDGDGLADNVEIQQSYQVRVFGQEPLSVLSSPGRRDTDGDGLDDAEERTRGTAANDVDTDNDGLSDRDEVEAGTNPLNPDTDGDGLIDGVEVRLGSDPNNADTDGDGVNDLQEVQRGTDVAVADHVITVTYTVLFLEELGSCDGTLLVDEIGEFQFDLRVDIPVFGSPPEDTAVASHSTVKVRFCDNADDPGACRNVVSGETVIQLSSTMGPGFLSINRSVQFLMSLEESFRLHGSVQERDGAGIDFTAAFSELFIGFNLRKGTRRDLSYSFPRPDCTIHLNAAIRVE